MAAQSHAAEANNPGVAARTLKHLSRDEAAHMDIGVFGQQPGMQIYTQILYVFDKTADRGSVISTLETGLARLVATFPWLGGQIVLSPKDNRRHFAPLAGGPPPLVVKDVPEDILTYEALRASGYAIRLLDESVVAPRRTLPSPDEPAEMPVLLEQATFLKDGLFLTVVCHHAAMDMVGQTSVIEWLAKACRGEQFSEEELAVGNGDRIDAVDLLDVEDPFSLIPEQVLPPPAATTDTKTEAAPPPPPPPVTSAWSYFNFSKAAVQALKDEATSTLPKDSTVPFVSTNDALSAFLWQSTLRARRQRLDASTPSTFARAIDVRRIMGVARNYPGLLQNMTIHTHPSSWVCDASLGEASSELRAAILQPDRLRERTRALATCFINHPDQANRLSFVGHVDPTAGGLMLSSWMTAPGITTDFGIGGLPAAVRRPGFFPVESLAYLMPSDGDGTVAACICLREVDLALLTSDPAFTKYAQYVG
ncbi:hypothetical protein Sste5346_008413 [Sporothrix stenoceras]|uniref:Trichothecene 3-O-acetyltransferase-like N-terminal domain-containing protein n=1 Tax=Sporothrix stenoceras TaxID=5173 RepID=A0ABR3YP37_9PEZI